MDKNILCGIFVKGKHTNRGGITMYIPNGTILTLVGLFASGKSSLIEGMMDTSTNDKVMMLPTYTTRLPRNPTEVNGKSKEYRFVNHSNYNSLKKNSKKWDERVAAGEYYGIDVEEIERGVSEGIIYLTTMLPHPETVSGQTETFDCSVLQILVDTPLEVCNRRLLERNHDVSERLKLQNSLDVASCRNIVHSVFTPGGHSVSADIEKFLQDYKVLCT